RSNLYVNVRKLMDDVVTFDKFKWYVEGFVHDKGLKPDYFLGVPEGMTKLGLIITYTKSKHDIMFSYESYLSEGYSKVYPLPMARGKIKEHGSEKDKRFLGGLEGKVVVFEDVLTTGDSAISLVGSLKKNKAEVLAVIGIVDRLELRDDGLSVAKKFSKISIDYFSMTDIKSLIPLACERLKLSEDLLKKIKSYYKKHGSEEIKL
ncbi:MAG: hypothetical protein Q8N77_02320, partial [Nanoarchaeota archaeon]|nr:hypothetical protein [Nanoarchaeota archaeon]